MRLLLAYYRLLAIVKGSDFDQNFFGKTIYQMQSEFVVVFSNFPVWDKMTFLGHLNVLAIQAALPRSGELRLTQKLTTSQMSLSC